MQTMTSANYYPQKIKDLIRTIPNAVQKPIHTKTNSGKAIKQCLSIGRLDQQKDHQSLIIAFSKLLIIHPNIELTIYGEGSERATLENLISSLNLQNKIKLPGVIKNIHEALVKADLFIFPSKYEGFPNALCEAMAVGVPVVASNCTGNIDIVRTRVNGRIFEVGDIESLVRAVDEAIQNPQLTNELAETAKQIIDEFSTQKIFAQWDEVVDSVCANSGLK